MKEEGVIKFQYQWTQEPPLKYECLPELNKWRDKLFSAGLIGEDKSGIGYGNLSHRLDENSFVITGSGTGGLVQLDPSHFTRVIAYSFIENSLHAVGPVKASSESLTHAAIYETIPTLNAVFHVHHHGLWERLLSLLPSTPNQVAYGTPAMACEIGKLLKDPTVLKEGILAMGGHEDGILSFGKSIDEAGQSIERWLSGW